MNFFDPSALNFSTYCMEKYGTIENLQRKAKSGEITAQVDLGMAYSEGLGEELPKDTDKAIGWLNTAVERGYELPFALAKLGELLDWKGTNKHRRKAYEMYQRAARLGCTSSQINLAEMYRSGVEGVVNEDLSEAFEWYKKAAGEDPSNSCSPDLGEVGKLLAGTLKRVETAMGDEQRKSALKCLYKYNLAGDCPEGRPQPTKAIYYLTRTAELGDTEAQLELGLVYLYGGCEQIKDVARAKRWLEKAASNGDAKAKELLQQCEQLNMTQHSVSDVKVEALIQSFDIMAEKLKQRSEIHPLAILQPVIFSEKMLSESDWSPTAKIYLQAFKLVKKGWEILHKSNFTDKRGISLIAYGYLTENSILQAFPLNSIVKTEAFHLCEITLKRNSRFFEGLVISFAFQGAEKKKSIASLKADRKKIMCLENIIYFIRNAEPDSPASKDPFKFDESYTSWLHVLYFLLGGIYIVACQFEKAGEAFENSLKCCPSYFPAKRFLGYSLLNLYSPMVSSQMGTCSEDELKQVLLDHPCEAPGRKVSRYSLWTKEKLFDGAEKTLKEFLAEAPTCWKSYPNVCYYLAQLALLTKDMVGFKKSYELGQDAEEKRLPFFNPVDLPLKESMTPIYQLFANVKLSIRCGNRMCTKNVKESKLLRCSSCRKQKYCGNEKKSAALTPRLKQGKTVLWECQTADWKNHKTACCGSGESKRKETAMKI